MSASSLSAQFNFKQLNLTYTSCDDDVQYVVHVYRLDFNCMWYALSADVSTRVCPLIIAVFFFVSALQNSKDAQSFGSQQQVILLDTVSQSLYLVMGKMNETLEWQKQLKVTANDNGISLDDQQITKDEIPVIVEKCINFIYAHGTDFFKNYVVV